MGESVRGSAGLGPAAARPLALSVVADGRSAAADAGQLARLAGRLELAGVWWREPPLTGPPADNLPALLNVLGSGSAPAFAGLITDARRLPGLAVFQTARAFSIRLAICSTGPKDEVAELRDALGGELAWPSALDTDPSGASALFVPVRPERDLDLAVAGAAAHAAGRPVLAEVAVSVGRTSAEARARADGEELFAVTGHPREQGLFGTLEECQATAARLRHAGVTELVCYLPRSPDLPDVLAQLRAISVGAGALRPGEPPSEAPPPPAGWGGRRPA